MIVITKLGIWLWKQEIEAWTTWHINYLDKKLAQKVLKHNTNEQKFAH